MNVPALSVPSVKVPNFLRRESCVAADAIKSRLAAAQKAVDDATETAMPAATPENLRRLDEAKIELQKVIADLQPAVAKCELDSSKILGVPTPWFYGLLLGAAAFVYVKRDKLFRRRPL